MGLSCMVLGCQMGLSRVVLGRTLGLPAFRMAFLHLLHRGERRACISADGRFRSLKRVCFWLWYAPLVETRARRRRKLRRRNLAACRRQPKRQKVLRLGRTR